jgi:sulfite reductase alpha subunit-like flavoprotein
LFKFDILLGEIDLNTLFSAPGNVITGSGINEALQEFPMQDVTASSFKEEQSLIYDLQNISSMWDYARGGTPRRRETATGIIRLQQAAQSRNEWLLRKLDAYVLQPLCRRILVYLREEMKKGDMIEIIGEQRADTVREFYDLDPEDVKRMFKIMPLTESIVSIKEMNQNQFLQAFDRLIQLPDINRPALIKQLLQKLGQKDVKQILPELSAAGQEGLVAGVNQARQAPPGPPGMPGPPVAGLGGL